MANGKNLIGKCIFIFNSSMVLLVVVKKITDSDYRKRWVEFMFLSSIFKREVYSVN